jgi:hypothetical protein
VGAQGGLVMESGPGDTVRRDGVLSRGKARARGPVSVPLLILGLAQLAIFALMAVLASTSAYFPFDVPVERWIQELPGGDGALALQRRDGAQRCPSDIGGVPPPAHRRHPEPASHRLRGPGLADGTDIFLRQFDDLPAATERSAGGVGRMHMQVL